MCPSQDAAEVSQDRGHWPLLEIRCTDWLSRSGDMSQNRGHWPFASLKTQILFLSLFWVRRENEFAFLILLLDLLSLSYVIKVDVRERLVQYFQQWANWSNWEGVILHCWFSANGRFLKVREGRFALLIPSKWKISQSERGSNGGFLKNMCSP